MSVIYIRDKNGKLIPIQTIRGEPGKDGNPGKDGKGIKSAVLNDNYTLTLTFDDDTSYTTPSIRGAAGSDGLDGIDGMNGKDGKDGVSPTIEVSRFGTDTTISITDKNGTKTATIFDGLPGVDGMNGEDGKDGTSVTIKSISESTSDSGNNVVTFSDGKTLTVKNGSKGNDGEPGFVWRGNWINGTQYLKGDVVFYEGSTYICVVDGLPDGIAPGTEDWEVVSVGIKTIFIEDDNLKVTLDNHTTLDLGNIKGAKGDDGRTPVKGTDYFTELDKQEIAELAAGLVDVGSSGVFIVSDTPPEDTSVFWIDKSDGSNDGFQEALNDALAQAKASGEFDGKDYVLTDSDRTVIVNEVLQSLPTYNGEVV